MALEVLSGKLTPEVKEQFQAAQQNSEALTFNAFIELLLEAYLNPKTKTVEVSRPSDEQIQEIQLKNNKIGELQTAYDLQKQQIEALGEECRLLSKQLTEKEPSGPQLADNEIIVSLGPVIKKVLEIEVEIANKKKNTDAFTIGKLLVDNYCYAVENGKSYPVKIWDRAELKLIEKEINQ